MYIKQEWNNGTKLDANRLNHIEKGIYDCSVEIEKLKSVEKVDFTDDIETLKKICEEQKDVIDKLKKDLTSLKTKVTKLQKAPKTEEE